MNIMKTFRAVIETEISLTHENVLDILCKAIDFADAYDKESMSDSIEDISLKTYNMLGAALEWFLEKSYNIENNAQMYNLLFQWFTDKWDEKWVQDLFKSEWALRHNEDDFHYNIFDYPIFD